MSLNLHIENIDGGGDVNDIIISPPPSSPPSYEKAMSCIRKGKNKGDNETKLISYTFFKKFIYPNLIKGKKNGKHFLYKKQLQYTLDYLDIKYKRSDKKEVLQEILFESYKTLAKYDTPSTISKINLLKRNIAKYIKEKREKIYGPDLQINQFVKIQKTAIP